MQLTPTRCVLQKFLRPFAPFRQRTPRTVPCHASAGASIFLTLPAVPLSYLIACSTTRSRDQSNAWDYICAADGEGSTRRQMMQVGAAAMAAACMPGSMLVPGTALAAGGASSLFTCMRCLACSMQSAEGTSADVKASTGAVLVGLPLPGQ